MKSIRKDPTFLLAILLVAVVLAVVLAGPTLAADYNRTCSVTGASAQQLSSVLSTCGYTGGISLQELTIRNPDSAANDLYFGQSDVSAVNGFKLSPGESVTWRATNQGDSIEAGRLYLFVSSTQSESFSLRSK